MAPIATLANSDDHLSASCTFSHNLGPEMLRVANFTVEYKRNKFRFRLPSRRQEEEEDTSGTTSECSSPSSSPDSWTRFPSWPSPPSSPPHFDTIKNSLNDREHLNNGSSITKLNANNEYVYFDDLMKYIKDVLHISGESVFKLDAPNELSYMANYRCIIYNSDILCFNFILRYDGHVIDTLMSDYSSPYGIKRNLVEPNASCTIPPQTKVFNESSLHLFKEAFNLAMTLKAAKSVSSEEWNEEDCEDEGELIVDDFALEDGQPNRDMSPPNFDDLPLTRSPFSITMDSDLSEDDEQSTLFDTQFTAGTDEPIYGDEESEMDMLPERCLLDSEEEEEDEMLAVTFTDKKPRRRRVKSKSSISYDRTSMSTIFSEESFQVVLDDAKEHEKVSFEISDSSDSEDDMEDEQEILSKASRRSESKSSKRKAFDDQEAGTESARSAKSIRSDESEFEDPYENLDSLNAQERCLDENDIVYTQTMEIISDDECGSDGKPRESSNTDLVSLLERMPLHDVDASIAYMQEHLLLKKSDIRTRQALVRQMEQVLKNHGFNCQLYIFGSTKNCLGMRTSSDIDIFIQIKDKHGHIVDESHISYGKIELVLNSIDRILGNDQSYLDVLPLGNGSKADVTVNTICHRHMRVPITRIKIYLNSTPIGNNATVNEITQDQVIQFDLNVNNALGIANTRLIRFLCKFEPRFFVLNVLLRLWCKYEAHLNKPDALSSYALSNLILFFCQARKPALLPPIDYFVSLSEKPKIVNDWRCDFCKDLSRINFKTTNKESVMQLFIGFFEFYKGFNFLQFKISTRFGRAWRLPFKKRNRRGAGARGGGREQFPYVHIMDPFEQNHNLTARMRPQMFDKMCLEFNNALERYAKYL